MANLPYNPTAAYLFNAHQSDIVHILQPINGTSSIFQLNALNVSGTVDTANVITTVISPVLPFSNDRSTSFTSIGIENNTILAYTGDCRNETTATLRKYTANEDCTNGTWTSRVVTGSLVDGAPRYLSAIMTFSPTIDGYPDVYIYGGMCPNSSTLSDLTWQASANYSDTTVLLESSPLASSAFQQSDVEAKMISSRDPPIPEAGFSATALEPSFFNSSDGITSQQQNFVLLGGHTEEAFINLSSIALFSLPERSWAFLPVQPPQGSVDTDLAARDTNDIDPRSGHTAVLTSDGQRIVIFGGWVGDVTTPASPQLAILELGEGFGGSGVWQWTIPEQNGAGPPGGDGIYGHGAVMLPGEVMMIVGGRSILESQSTTSGRAESSQSTAYYFYNISSSSWMSHYTNPKTLSNRGASSSPDAGVHHLGLADKAGIGAGLGIGLAAVIGLLVVYFCCLSRRRCKRHVHEVRSRDLSSCLHRLHSPVLDLGENDGRHGEKATADGIEQYGSSIAYPWAPLPSTLADTDERSGLRELQCSDAERTGLLVEIPNPTRGLRRSLHSRGTYQPPSWYEEGRMSRGSGHIHPIDERDEYNEDFHEKTLNGDLEKARIRNLEVLSAAPVLDPFRDPAPLGSHPVVFSRTPSPQSPARERELEVQNWVSDWTVADALMHSQTGRVSPDKTDRTSSTLSERSERSIRSNISAHSTGGLGRSVSQRSTYLPSNAKHEVGALMVVPSGSRIATKDVQSPNRRSQSLTLNTKALRSQKSDLFTTKGTSFSQLQAEGEALLGKHSEPYERPPSRSHSRAKAWMGNMRRALALGDPSISTSPESGDRSASSSPTKSQYTETDIPRRAASTGTMLWRRKQGAKDWDEEGLHSSSEGQGVASTARGDDEEWDVESAVERRVVQVMFTVPKEKLRVVNGTPEGDGESIASLESGIDGKHMEPKNDATGHNDPNGC
ncbi:hypothetical protein MMC14_004737 [Varicellaria rhodocarpa]|nr:hypothetical protein [Varicellaria rhodocarpa]